MFVILLCCQCVHSEPYAGSVIILCDSMRVSATCLLKAFKIFDHLNLNYLFFIFFLDNPSFSTQPLKSCFAYE